MEETVLVCLRLSECSEMQRAALARGENRTDRCRKCGETVVRSTRTHTAVPLVECPQCLMQAMEANPEGDFKVEPIPPEQLREVQERIDAWEHRQ